MPLSLESKSQSMATKLFNGHCLAHHDWVSLLPLHLPRKISRYFTLHSESESGGFHPFQELCEGRYVNRNDQNLI